MTALASDAGRARSGIVPILLCVVPFSQIPLDAYTPGLPQMVVDLATDSASMQNTVTAWPGSRQRKAARSRYADSQPGEAARAGRDRYPIKLLEFDGSAIHHACDQRHQRLGMAALHGQRLARHDGLPIAIEHGS